MKKQLKIWTIHSVIVLPILVFTLTISQPCESGINEDEVAVANWQVYNACNDALNQEDDGKKDAANFVCRILTDMVYEQNNYHQSYITYFQKEGYPDAIKFADAYSVTGCDISGLEFKDLIHHYIDYMNMNEDEMDRSFFWTIESALRPYCMKLIDRSIDYYLDDEDGRRKS